MNTDILEGKWKQLRGVAQERWGKLTNDDLDMIAGKRKQLAGKLQERYGYSRQTAEQEINHFVSDLNGQLDEARAKVETAAQQARKQAEQVQAGVTDKVAEGRRRVESTTRRLSAKAEQLRPQKRQSFLQRNRSALLISALIVGLAVVAFLRSDNS